MKNRLVRASAIAVLGNTTAVDDSLVNAAAFTYENNEIIGPPTQINGILAAATQQ